MWVYLRNGRSFLFPGGKRSEADAETGYLYVLGTNDRNLASFRIDAVACWYFDNVLVTTCPAEGVRS